MTKTPIYQTKTFWTGVIAIVTAVGSFAAGEIALGAAMQMVSASLLGVFLREGISREARRL